MKTNYDKMIKDLKKEFNDAPYPQFKLIREVIQMLKAQDTPTELPEKIKIDHYENPFHYHKSIGFNELHDIATPIIQARDREIEELREKVRSNAKVIIEASATEVLVIKQLQQRIATLESRVGVEKIEETIKKEWLPKDNGRNYYVGEDDEAECIAKAISTMVLGEGNE